MVRPIIPQPITDMGYKGMDFLQKFKGKLGENKAPISQGGSFMQNAEELTAMNGTTDTMGMPSQGAQELAQKVEQNEKTGVQQKFVDLMNKLNPFDRIFPDNRVDYTNPDGTTQKVNPDFDKLLKNRPDLKERFDRTGSIYSDM